MGEKQYSSLDKGLPQLQEAAGSPGWYHILTSRRPIWGPSGYSTRTTIVPRIHR
ncbi:hypothetical protein DPMN_014161 [Dreissena polymorpha]|uniref:Uncharacterized protein n=1 Tax=Dreissena polymorpha TaxID=45954 RepID=A0A9D4N6R6_DREPO|nr:hypothetical protein DPMN_014161 [Dreissena polymorpha]